ncbi:hypothetical protein D3C73_1043110 [compost metagenome]
MRSGEVAALGDLSRLALQKTGRSHGLKGRRRLLLVLQPDRMVADGRLDIEGEDARVGGVIRGAHAAGRQRKTGRVLADPVVDGRLEILLVGGLGIGTPGDQGCDGGKNDDGSHDSFPFSAQRAINSDTGQRQTTL